MVINKGSLNGIIRSKPLILQQITDSDWLANPLPSGFLIRQVEYGIYVLLSSLTIYKYKQVR